jgi:hypothetical protein
MLSMATETNIRYENYRVNIQTPAELSSELSRHTHSDTILRGPYQEDQHRRVTAL